MELSAAPMGAHPAAGGMPGPGSSHPAPSARCPSVRCPSARCPSARCPSARCPSVRQRSHHNRGRSRQTSPAPGSPGPCPSPVPVPPLSPSTPCPCPSASPAGRALPRGTPEPRDAHTCSSPICQGCVWHRPGVSGISLSEELQECSSCSISPVPASRSFSGAPFSEMSNPRRSPQHLQCFVTALAKC